MTPSQKAKSQENGVTQQNLLAILAEQGFKCALTGDELTPENVAADHIKPLSLGGSEGIENVWLVTEKANKAKGTMSLEEFVSLCRKVTNMFPHV